MRPVATAVEESTDTDSNQEQNFDCRQECSDAATELNSSAIDDDGDTDRHERYQLQPAKRKIVTGRMQREVNVIQDTAKKVVEKNRESDGQRRRRGAARNRELRPAINESPRSTVRIAHDAVLARRARKHRKQFRVGQRA